MTVCPSPKYVQEAMPVSRGRKENATAPSGLAFIDEKGKAPLDLSKHPSGIWCGDVEAFLRDLPDQAMFDLIVSSPPYNLGKSYEAKSQLEEYPRSFKATQN